MSNLFRCICRFSLELSPFSISIWSLLKYIFIESTYIDSTAVSFIEYRYIWNTTYSILKISEYLLGGNFDISRNKIYCSIRRENCSKIILNLSISSERSRGSCIYSIYYYFSYSKCICREYNVYSLFVVAIYCWSACHIIWSCRHTSTIYTSSYWAIYHTTTATRVWDKLICCSTLLSTFSGIS